MNWINKLLNTLKNMNESMLKSLKDSGFDDDYKPIAPFGDLYQSYSELLKESKEKKKNPSDSQ